MKYLGTTICIIIAGVLITGLIYADINYFNSLPHIVNYSVNIPRAFNASAFSYYTFLPGNNYPLTSSTIYQFPYSINGTGRVGNSYDLRVTYYGGNITGLVDGNNVKEIPRNNELGSLHYNIQIQEINDNQVSTYDLGFFAGIVVGSAIILCVCGFLASSFFPSISDEDTSSTTTGNEGIKNE